MFSFLKPRNNEQAHRCRYLVSTSGLPNLGDEFITRAWLHYLSIHEPESDIWLDCSNPSHASLLFKGIHPHLHVVNTLWQLVWNTRHLLDDSEAAVKQIRHWIDNAGTPREDFGIDLLYHADSIHFLGGGYINQLWKANALLLVAAAQIKRHNPQTGLYATGLGLYPLEDIDLRIVRNALDEFDHVSVRDTESADLTHSSQLPDDAFLELGNDLWKDTKYSGRAFVCLQQDVVGKHPQAIRTITESLLVSGIDKAETLTLMEAVPPDDAWSIDAFREQWPGDVRILPFSHLWNIGFPASPQAIWVSSRFHVHLLAAASGARGLALQFGNDYYSVKHHSLQALGTGWPTLHIKDEGDSHPMQTMVNIGFPEYAAELTAQKMAEANTLYR